MCYYYYKDGEKIGPVVESELRNLAEWGDITPATIIEKNNGNQVSAADTLPATCFWAGTNRLGIPLDAACRRVALCNNTKLFCLLGLILDFFIMFAAGCEKSVFLQVCCFIAGLAMAGLIVWAEYYKAKKLGKVPPKPIDD